MSNVRRIHDTVEMGWHRILRSLAAPHKEGLADRRVVALFSCDKEAYGGQGAKHFTNLKIINIKRDFLESPQFHLLRKYR